MKQSITDTLKNTPNPPKTGDNKVICEQGIGKTDRKAYIKARD